MSKIQRIAPHAGRLLLGLLFTVFGLNGFLHFMPNPPVPDAAGSFLGALAATGYMFPLIKGTEVLAGLALLSNRYVPLALILLSPVVVNIFAFHVILAPAPIGAFVLLLTAYLGYAYRNHFAGLFVAKTQPKQASADPVVAQRLADAE